MSVEDTEGSRQLPSETLATRPPATLAVVLPVMEGSTSSVTVMVTGVVKVLPALNPIQSY